MKMAFFSISARGESAEADGLNRLLAAHRIRDIRRRFVDVGADSYWAVCVVYFDAAPPSTAVQGEGAFASKGRIDYREVLSSEQFEVYSRMRNVRKDLAARDGVPIYHVVTNDQLATIVQKSMTSKAELSAVPGFGASRLAKYGEALLAALASARAPTKSPNAEA